MAGRRLSFLPSIDITETDKAIEVSAEMPGLERKDVEISIDDDTLTIPGEKRIEEDQKDKNVQHGERCYRVFMRVLQLPPGVDPSSVDAAMSDHDTEAGQPGAEEDRGQGRSKGNDRISRLKPRRSSRDAHFYPPPASARLATLR
ncbi:Hsp20/alpha crystallin family protein [Bradyrhizobium sp. UFLA05-153]